ncbi:hypothetical protein PflCFBP13510_01220 [Pseudomonas fluorescens]|nr:hypothetical protein PflCFBP13510_01220 [Pseudomonas fluorescens]
MLAKNVNDNACFLDERGACEFFASKLAPTKALQPNSGVQHVQPRLLAATRCPSNLHQHRLDRRPGRRRTVRGDL